MIRVSSPSRFNDSMLAAEGFTLSFKGHATDPLAVNSSADEVSACKPVTAYVLHKQQRRVNNCISQLLFIGTRDSG